MWEGCRALQVNYEYRVRHSALPHRASQLLRRRRFLQPSPPTSLTCTPPAEVAVQQYRRMSRSLPPALTSEASALPSSPLPSRSPQHQRLPSPTTCPQFPTSLTPRVLLLGAVPFVRDMEHNTGGDLAAIIIVPSFLLRFQSRCEVGSETAPPLPSTLPIARWAGGTAPSPPFIP